LAFVLRLYPFDPLPALRSVRCPLLAVWGEEDEFVPVAASVRAFEEALQDAGNENFQLRVLSGADHFLFVGPAHRSEGAPPPFPDSFVESLIEWVRECSLV